MCAVETNAGSIIGCKGNNNFWYVDYMWGEKMENHGPDPMLAAIWAIALPTIMPPERELRTPRRDVRKSRRDLSK